MVSHPLDIMLSNFKDRQSGVIDANIIDEAAESLKVGGVYGQIAIGSSYYQRYA
jgi:hypothetical protein